MTTIKWPTRFAVLLVAAMLAPACGLEGGGPGGSTPVPVPSVAPVPVPIIARPFNVEPRIFGFIAPTPLIQQPGTLIFEATWGPQPPDGQIFLFLIPFTQGPVDIAMLNACYRDPMCPQVLARDITPGYPKRIEYRLPPGVTRVEFWVRGTEGHTTGTVNISLLPDN